MSQILTDDIRIGPNTCTGSLNAPILRLAHIFRVLRHSLDEVDRYYETLTPPPARPAPTIPSAISTAIPAPFFGPCFTQFVKEPEQAPVMLTYIRRLIPEYVVKTVFEARMTSDGDTAGKRVVVKFTDRYCEDGHRLLAGHGLAPALIHCERMDSLGGLWVLVMDYVDEVQGGKKEWIVQDVERALKLLHEANIVFGDLRDPNILRVRREGYVGAMLVDFDWAGVEGEVRYPMGINLEVSWAPGTDPDELIMKEHDQYMFDEFKKGL